MIRAALTGHRPERLGYSKESYASPDWQRMIGWLKRMLRDNEVTDAYCGMAHGADIAYGLAVCQLKIEGYPIKLHCILPCKNYNAKDSMYKYLKYKADEWVELSEEFYKGCDDVRDQYMVDHSDKLFAIWDGNKSGGVWSTIRKAQKKCVDIIYYPRENI